jgi:hypothetical protein
LPLLPKWSSDNSAKPRRCGAGARVTYLQLEKRRIHVRVGSSGRRNWRVMGRQRPVMSRPATNVFAKGPGASLTDRAKMATMARNRYWAS